MKRLMAVLAAACMVVSLAAVTAGGGAQATPQVPSAADLGALSWTSCGGLQCSTLVVPRSYANPSAGTVKLKLSRKVHTAEPYLGIMLTNPGGPGGSGLGLPLIADEVPDNVGDHYDWIGFDPRGVGSSVPALRCNTGYFGSNRPSFVPTTAAIKSFWEVKTALYAKRCGESAAKSILPFVSTRSTVKDMERIRQVYQANAGGAAVLDKLNFYGFSYGSYLGQVYAVSYPQRVGKFVLDGIVDPTRYWYLSNLDQEVGFDRNLNKFFQWMAAHNSTFKLGWDWVKIRQGFNTMLRKLDRYPAADGNLGPSELTDAMLGAAYYVYGWADIGDAYARLVRGGGGWGLFGIYAGANMGDDNGYAMYLATQCTDTPRPAWSQQIHDAWRIHRDDPFLAWDNTWFNAPCRAWRAPSGTRIPVNGSGVTAPILLINETLDAATPYGGALKVKSLFPSASLIAGVDGTTHSGSLSGVVCVDDKIADYLKPGGTAPVRDGGTHADVRCPRVPPPPSSLSTRTAARDAMSAGVRAELLAAQRASLR